MTGDLEQVVLKAIAKDPDRRYASAAALADDIEMRSKNGQPVLVGTVSIEKSERLASTHTLVIESGRANGLEIFFCVVDDNTISVGHGLNKRRVCATDTRG